MDVGDYAIIEANPAERNCSSYNDALRLSERRLHFNVDELKRVAAEAVGQSFHDIKNIRKLAEGGLNRVFRISLCDGSRVIARIPYPIIQPESAAVGSEVATLDFLRSHGIPVPRVYAYSADKG